MEGFKEKSLVENYIVEELIKNGWEYVPPEELERESFEEPLLVSNLLRAIKRINSIPGLTQEDINRALTELKLIPTGIEGSKKILQYYKHGIPVKLEKEGVVERIKLFDYENIENNEFIVTRQVNYQGKEKIRTDVMLYINGIPLVNIECKNPTSVSESWSDAYRQIKDYETAVPELYKYVQIGVAVEAIAKYFPIVPWQENVKFYEWKEEGRDSIDSTIIMFSRDKLLDILRNFLFFRIEMGNATKVITRYMQYRAANKMVERVIKNIKGEDDKDTGLIWHWQGSGKTLTMIFAAIKLFYSKVLENPTIFFILDRIDLKDQLYTEFNALDTIKPEKIETARGLKDMLKSSDYMGKRGIFITLIHKFKPEDFQAIQKHIETKSRDSETIMNRRNVVAFIDEAHRTQYGLLAAQMKSILKNAFFFALTGTPISKIDRNTYLQFSYPPLETHLDRYFITDSIRDGFTVKIVYQPRLEKSHLKEKMFEAFIETEFEELPEIEREIVEEELKKRLTTIKLYLENPKRIEFIAKDIASHFMKNFDGKFKGMVVAASRNACVRYKRALDKYLPREYSETVMTYSREDKELITSYVREARAFYEGKDYDTIKKETIDNFKFEEYPKILIVTDMLLTGFDAPILQVMYLDKPLKEHRLLQAVARTNRPYRDIKEAGIVIDYVGVLKEFKRALEMYNEEDLKGALFNYDSVRKEFREIIAELIKLLSDLPQSFARETLLRAVEVLTGDAEKEREFSEKFRKLRKIFEILGPDEVKLDYFNEYKWLTGIYNYYYKMVLRKEENVDLISRYYSKTVEHVYKTTEIEGIEESLPVMEIDDEYMQKIEEKVENKKEKAANILFALNKLVLVDKQRNPIYESLVERVERLMELWRERVKDYEEIYRKETIIMKDMNSLTVRQKELHFDDMEYAMLLSVERSTGEAEKIERDIKELSLQLRKSMFPGWINQTTVRKQVERKLRRYTRRFKTKYNLSMEEMNYLFERLVKNVENYSA